MNQYTFERYEKKCLLNAAEERATDWEISDRDRDGTYDAASAVYIQLSGDGVFIDGDGVMVEGSTITPSRRKERMLFPARWTAPCTPTAIGRSRAARPRRRMGRRKKPNPPRLAKPHNPFLSPGRAL